ncbi:hypothetical protein HDU81_007151 [Chytriomyces hyalinus]|nr:hypothetical protein HDU81_007151 [Chytriomyces hyalinus]
MTATDESATSSGERELDDEVFAFELDEGVPMPRFGGDMFVASGGIVLAVEVNATLEAGIESVRCGFSNLIGTNTVGDAIGFEPAPLPVVDPAEHAGDLSTARQKSPTPQLFSTPMEHVLAVHPAAPEPSCTQ